MIGSEGLEGQSRDQMRATQNDELSWPNREAHKQKRAGAFSNSPLWDGSADCEVLASKIAPFSQIGNIKPKVR
jgi:hypothetical protein